MCASEDTHTHTRNSPLSTHMLAHKDTHTHTLSHRWRARERGKEKERLGIWSSVIPIHLSVNYNPFHSLVMQLSKPAAAVVNYSGGSIDLQRAAMCSPTHGLGTFIPHPGLCQRKRARRVLFTGALDEKIDHRHKARGSF